MADFNTQGQVVGKSLLNYQNPSLGTYAAFTSVNFQSHDYSPTGAFVAFSQVADNLNNDIPPLSGVSLTAALQIDDDGRILAKGSNGDTYLLTPTALGTPTPIPEPTSVLLYGLAAAALGLRAGRRRLMRGQASESARG